eukprot:Phypoly_transcript_02303.p1 GENE.Phypoly_transcript_02303~~Phypoly_transcript_02303.p1  ORF type:complete len:213 (-),score=31.74 Phypoly_transcript_02303:23-661(-)
MLGVEAKDEKIKGSILAGDLQNRENHQTGIQTSNLPHGARRPGRAGPGSKVGGTPSPVDPASRRTEGGNLGEALQERPAKVEKRRPNERPSSRPEVVEPTQCADCGGTADSNHIVNSCLFANKVREALTQAGAICITEEAWRRDWIPEDKRPPAPGTEEAADIIMTVAKAAIINTAKAELGLTYRSILSSKKRRQTAKALESYLNPTHTPRE